MDVHCELGQNFGGSHKLLNRSLCMHFYMINIIKFVVKAVSTFFKSIKDIFLSIFVVFQKIISFFKGIVAFVKGLIDFIYKMFFILFFCVIAYAGYKVFTSASVINKKIDELQSNIRYIKQIYEDLSKVTEKISGITQTASKASDKAGKITGKLKGLF